jgi:hypothetical protein
VCACQSGEKYSRRLGDGENVREEREGDISTLWQARRNCSKLGLAKEGTTRSHIVIPIKDDQEAREPFLPEG